MRTSRLTLSAAISALLIAAGPVLAQDPVVIPPADPDAAAPVGPLIDDTGPLPDVGADVDAPAAASEPVGPSSPPPIDARGRSVYGVYLAGRSALLNGETRTGAEYLASGYEAAPDQERIRAQAFTTSLLAGDLDLAGRIAPTEGSPALVEAGRLVQAVRGMAQGRARQANAALSSESIAFPHARAGLMIQPWIAAEAGDWDRALMEPPPEADAVARAFAGYHRALLLEIRRDYAGAQAQYSTLLAQPATGDLLRGPYGEFLERRGRRDEALAVYETGIAAGETSFAEDVSRIRSRAEPPALPTIREGAAMGLQAAAAAALAENANEFAVLYLRLSLSLRSDAEARFHLGVALDKADMKLAARDAWASVPASSPALYAASRQRLAWSLDEAGQREAAVQAMQEAMAAEPGNPGLIYSLATLLAGQERYEEALTLLNSPEINTADQAWQVRFQRGAVYESMGRIPEAEAELWAAVQAAPDNPEVLNYLGYLWVDSGTRVAEGAEMITRAVAADPENGHIQDSLGWAQYRQGQYEQAVETLERAIALEPASAEINDHLGDAYWQVGRRREAVFQWNHVLTLDAEAETRAAAEAKIAGGLDAVRPNG